MKITILKNMMALLFASVCAISCNSRTETEGGIESDIENPPTSQDSVTSYKNTESVGDTANMKKVDATRMSDGKDSVTGEVTPPNAQKQ